MRMFTTLLITLALTCAANAQSVPHIISYQGRLLDGTSLMSGDVGLALRLYDDPTAGTMWYQDSSTVTVVDGLYSTYLGDDNIVGSLRGALLQNAIYVEVEVNGVTLTPRERLASVGYAILPGMRGTNCFEGARWSVVGGGFENIVRTTAVMSAIGGGNQNRIKELSFGSFIGGGGVNIIGSNSPAAMIGGGVNNGVGDHSSHGTVAGGSANVIVNSSTGAVISGGSENYIGNFCPHATIGGGYLHRITANAYLATISGGYSNRCGSYSSVIAGGQHNRILEIAGGNVIGGGRDHLIDDCIYSTIGGGRANALTNWCDYSVIGGGSENKIHTGLQLVRSTIAGGCSNEITESFATIGGGRENAITDNGNYGTIPGGYEAAATMHGQMAYASGAFADPGDAQTCTYVLRDVTTSDGVWEDLYLDGTSQRISVPNGRSLTFDVLIVGRSDGGETGSYRVEGFAEGNAGSVNVGYGAPTEIYEDNTAWSVGAGQSGQNLRILVSGNGEEIRWVATVRTAEVTW